MQKAPPHNPLHRHNRTSHCNQIERQRRLLQKPRTQKRHEKSLLAGRRFNHSGPKGG
ncbi:hypothetical protein RISK_000363 [Rhodopirellula islandica]|uniref:Uncharacterized protein n=1 Tax=Rhodopirellula islandica TaxID=595434 RepID=A0A0J1BL83_RHOIS|nr:hypothetical protein RISK_000363 [Rhodopirellula islandica]